MALLAEHENRPRDLTDWDCGPLVALKIRPFNSLRVTRYGAEYNSEVSIDDGTSDHCIVRPFSYVSHEAVFTHAPLISIGLLLCSLSSSVLRSYTHLVPYLTSTHGLFTFFFPAERRTEILLRFDLEHGAYRLDTKYVLSSPHITVTDVSHFHFRNASLVICHGEAL